VDSNTNVLGLDLMETAKRIEAEPWIKKAVVRRELPDELWVRIWEHRARALVSVDHLYYVNDEGRPFRKVEPGDSLNLPVITGLSKDDLLTESPWRAAARERLITILGLLDEKASPIAGTMISEIHMEFEGDLEIVTRDHVRIRLGKDFYSIKVRRLAAVMEDLVGKDQWRHIQSIDLDYEELAVVKYRKSAQSREQV
jgi:cell division protein FtsQ